MVLLAVLLPIILTLTGSSLLLVWHRIRQQVTADLSSELRRSERAFRNAEAERFNALQREAALLSDLPSLKALLTTSDDLTIQNAAPDFWKVSGKELFSLAGPEGRVRSVDTTLRVSKAALARDLGDALAHPGRGYLVTGGHLFRYASSRVYFGDRAAGTALGTVIIGYEISSSYLVELNSAVDANSAFVSRGVLLGSSFPIAAGGAQLQPLPVTRPGEAVRLLLDGEPYLAAADDLSTRANVPLQVIFYRSLRPAAMEIHDISRQLVLLGVAVVALGSLLMVFVARRLTNPLEDLARRVRAFGEGKEHSQSTPAGTLEVRQLSHDFQAMQARIEESNQARLESERLATIGSMATSVSHDLRHHLASIYANAEFLAAPEVTEEERAEFFADIQAAVLGTTEMLESLTIFSRTGQVARHVPEQIGVLLQRAVTQMQMHPAASQVELEMRGIHRDVPVLADSRQLERAIFNLLLNACQSRRPPGRKCSVCATLKVEQGTAFVSVEDNGLGVPLPLQQTLFDPFVSSGKQNGTGLGLTLARRIAEDHGGQLVLAGSDGDRTVFELRLPISLQSAHHFPGASVAHHG